MIKRKRISIIGTNGLPARYGGFETLTDYLSKGLSANFDVQVYCSITPKNKRLKVLNNSKLIYIPLKANGWQSMIYDAVSIVHAFLTSEELIILGFSGVFAFPLRVLFSNKKIIFNIGGIEWQKVRGGKLFSKIEVAIKKWFERITIRFSDVIVVDNQVLWDYVKSEYGVDSELIEYGGDHAVKLPKTNDLIERYPFLNNEYDVSVSRAQEDMNIHVLIEAYKNLSYRNLVVVSNWEISDYGIDLKKTYKDKYPNIFLIDAIYSLQELNVIRSNASIYFHTHSLCGTAPSLVEAMSLGLPVLCYDVDTNRSSTEGRSYYFRDHQSLIEILGNLSQTEINTLGKEMKEIADRRYTWDRIISLYRKHIN